MLVEETKRQYLLVCGNGHVVRSCRKDVDVRDEWERDQPVCGHFDCR